MRAALLSIREPPHEGLGKLRLLGHRPCMCAPQTQLGAAPPNRRQKLCAYTGARPGSPAIHGCDEPVGGGSALNRIDEGLDPRECPQEAANEATCGSLLLGGSAAPDLDRGRERRAFFGLFNQEPPVWALLGSELLLPRQLGASSLMHVYNRRGTPFLLRTIDACSCMTVNRGAHTESRGRAPGRKGSVGRLTSIPSC